MSVTNPIAQMNPMQAMLGPDIARQQYELAQNQRYADILMQQALQEQPQGQMVSGHYVAPSPIQGLGQLLKAYIARRSSDLIPEQQAKLASAQMQKTEEMFGLGGGTTPERVRDLALAGGAMQGDVGPTNTNAARMTGVQTGTGSAMPVPMGMNPRAAMLQYLISPQAYATALSTHSNPTEFQKNLASVYPSGSPQYNAAMQGQIAKQNYISPTTLAPGAGLVMPFQTAPIYYAPDKNMQRVPGPNGTTSAVPVGNAAQIQAYNTGISKLAEGMAGLATTTEPSIDARGQGIASTKLQNIGGVNAIVNPFANIPGLSPNAQATPVEQPRDIKPAVISASPVEQDVAKGLNEDWRKNVLAPARVAASAADNILSSVDVLQSLDFKTGFGIKAQAEVASIFAAMGVKGAEKLATNAQLFEKEGAKALLNTLEKQKGSQTERDAITGKETFVRLSDTPQAKDFTLDLARSMALRDKHKADYFNRAVNMSDAHKGKLDLISESYKEVDPSVFDMPIGRTPDGKVITMRTKYGIK
jgi:hypothetical protein